MPDKKHLLIAEDESHTVLSLRIILKRAGYEPTFVGDGASALELLSTSLPGVGNGFDMLLTDIQMPKMTGIELIKTMKARNIKTPVLVLTGFGDKETLIELLREGCEDYIDKPFTEKLLLERVSSVLEKASSKRKEWEDAENILIETRRKLDSYRNSFSLSCESLDNAIHSYKKMMGAPVSSKQIKVSVKAASKDRLGGDYCAVHDFPWGCDLIVADVAGHDMGASYHTVLIKSFFDINSRLKSTGEEFMGSLNSELLNGGGNERMVCAIFVRINLDAMWLESVAASHPYMVDIKPSPTSEVMLYGQSPSGLPLGILGKPVLSVRRTAITPGERFFIYTDGLPDAKKLDLHTGGMLKFGEGHLLESFKRTAGTHLEDAVSSVWDEVMKFCNCKISDDMLLMGIEIPSPDEKRES